jgi:hypothetical protein
MANERSRGDKADGFFPEFDPQAGRGEGVFRHVIVHLDGDIHRTLAEKRGGCPHDPGQ